MKIIKPLKPKFKEKHVLKTTQLVIFGLRISLSKEDTFTRNPEGNKFNFIRYRNRTTDFVAPFRIDITAVSEEKFEIKDDAKKALKNALNREPDKYEVEVETNAQLQ